MINCHDVINDLRIKVSRLTNDAFTAVLLFGSMARCEGLGLYNTSKITL